MGPTWGQQDQGGLNVGPTNLAIWEWYINTDASSNTSSSYGWIEFELEYVLILSRYNTEHFTESYISIGKQTNKQNYYTWIVSILSH